MAQDEEWLEKRKCWNATTFFFLILFLFVRLSFFVRLWGATPFRLYQVFVCADDGVFKGTKRWWVVGNNGSDDWSTRERHFFFTFFTSFFDHRNKISSSSSKIEWIVRQFERIVVLSISQLIVGQDKRQKKCSNQQFFLCVFVVRTKLVLAASTSTLLFFRDVDRSLLPTANCQELSQQLLSFT